MQKTDFESGSDPMEAAVDWIRSKRREEKKKAPRCAPHQSRLNESNESRIFRFFSMPCSSIEACTFTWVGETMSQFFTEYEILRVYLPFSIFNF
jgi:hypothetical protein